MTIAAVTQGRLEPFQGLFLRLQRTLRAGVCRLHSVHATGLFPVMATNLLLLAQAHSGLVSRAQSLLPTSANHHDLQCFLSQASPSAGTFHLPTPRLLLSLLLSSLTETWQQAQRQDLQWACQLLPALA